MRLRVRRWAVLLAFGLLTVAFFTTLLYWDSPSKPFSSPTAIRTNSAYRIAHDAAANLPPFPDDLFAAVQLICTETNISVAAPSNSEHLPVYGPMQVQRAAATESFPIGSGSIQLKAIAVATEYRDEYRKGIGNTRVQPKYFAPDLSPISPAHPSLRIPPGQQHLVGWKIPTARFIFAASNLPPFKVLNFRAFDARTRFPVSSSHNLPQTASSFTFNCDLDLWHQTPVELVGLIAVDPTQVYSMPAETGAQINYPGGAIKVIAKSNYDLQATMIPDAVTGQRLSFSRPEPSAMPFGSEFFTVILAFWPATYHLPVDFEFFNRAGRRISGGFCRAVSERLIQCSIPGKPRQLAEIRAIHYYNLYRLIVTLPEIPGLPEGNRNLQNLFDIRIPELRVPDEFALQQVLGNLVQMDVGYLPLKSSAFRRRYLFLTNLTALDLFQSLENRAPSKQYHLVADPQKNEIQMRQNRFTKVIGGITSALGIN